MAVVIIPAGARTSHTGGQGFSRMSTIQTRGRPAKASTSSFLAAGTTIKANAISGVGAGFKPAPTRKVCLDIRYEGYIKRRPYFADSGGATGAALPVSPLLPCSPVAPCGPAGPGAAAGTFTTVGGLSQPVKPAKPRPRSRTEISIERFMVNPRSLRSRRVMPLEHPRPTVHSGYNGRGTVMR